MMTALLESFNPFGKTVWKGPNNNYKHHAIEYNVHVNIISMLTL